MNHGCFVAASGLPLTLLPEMTLFSAGNVLESAESPSKAAWYT